MDDFSIQSNKVIAKPTLNLHSCHKDVPTEATTSFPSPREVPGPSVPLIPRSVNVCEVPDSTQVQDQDFGPSHTHWQNDDTKRRFLEEKKSVYSHCPFDWPLVIGSHDSNPFVESSTSIRVDQLHLTGITEQNGGGFLAGRRAFSQPRPSIRLCLNAGCAPVLPDCNDETSSQM